MTLHDRSSVTSSDSSRPPSIFLQMHRLLVLTLLQQARVLCLNAHRMTAMEWHTAVSTPLSPNYGHCSFVSWLQLQLNPQMYRHLVNVHPRDSLKTKDQTMEPLQLGCVEFDHFVNSLCLCLMLIPLRWVTQMLKVGETLRVMLTIGLRLMSCPRTRINASQSPSFTTPGKVGALLLSILRVRVGQRSGLITDNYLAQAPIQQNTKKIGRAHV